MRVPEHVREPAARSVALKTAHPKLDDPIPSDYQH